jgi:hypothetical protein
MPEEMRVEMAEKDEAVTVQGFQNDDLSRRK